MLTGILFVLFFVNDLFLWSLTPSCGGEFWKGKETYRNEKSPGCLLLWEGSGQSWIQWLFLVPLKGGR